MIRTQIQLTEEQVDLLKNISAMQHVSIAQLVRKAVDNLVRTGSVDDIEERRKQSIEVIGKFHSGLHNLSSKHDDYFVDSID